MKKTISVKQTKEIDVCDRCGMKPAISNVSICSEPLDGTTASQTDWEGVVCESCMAIIRRSTVRGSRKRKDT